MDDGIFQIIHHVTSNGSNRPFELQESVLANRAATDGGPPERFGDEAVPCQFREWEGSVVAAEGKQIANRLNGVGRRHRTRIPQYSLKVEYRRHVVDYLAIRAKAHQLGG